MKQIAEEVYSRVHGLLVDLTVYHNDWGMFDFVRRFAVDALGFASDALKGA